MNRLRRWLVLGILAAGCAEQGAGQVVATSPSLETPFAFCARVGTDDRLDASEDAASRAAVEALAPYLYEALRLPRDASLPLNEIVWRCMDGKVYVCARGANLPCDSKADRAKLNRGAANYCRENPDAGEVPAYATGHRTIYRWSCLAGRAERGPAVSAVDHRGFRSDIWYVVK